MKTNSTAPFSQKVTTKEIWEKGVPEKEGLGDYFIIRYLSVPISRVLLNIGVSPDGATFLMLIWGLVGIGFIATGSYWLTVFGAAALIFHVVLDYVDGEMARYLKASSWTGHFLETITHEIVFGLLYPVIGWVVYNTYNENPFYLMLGAFAGVFTVANRSVRGKVAWAISNHLKGVSESSAERISGAGREGNKSSQRFLKKVLTQGRIRLLGFQEMIYFYLPLAIITQRLDWFLIYYSIAFPVVYFLKIITIYRSGLKEQAKAKHVQKPLVKSPASSAKITSVTFTEDNAASAS